MRHQVCPKFKMLALFQASRFASVASSTPLPRGSATPLDTATVLVSPEFQALARFQLFVTRGSFAPASASLFQSLCRVFSESNPNA